MFKFLKEIIGRQKSPEQIWTRAIINLGYEELGDLEFMKENEEYRVWISINEEGVKLKNYFPGYAESEYLNKPFSKKELKGFVRDNEAY